jgi:hypothetical protein
MNKRSNAIIGSGIHFGAVLEQYPNHCCVVVKGGVM